MYGPADGFSFGVVLFIPSQIDCDPSTRLSFSPLCTFPPPPVIFHLWSLPSFLRGWLHNYFIKTKERRSKGLGVSRIPCRIFFVGGLELFKAYTRDLPVSVTRVHLARSYFPFFPRVFVFFFSFFLPSSFPRFVNASKTLFLADERCSVCVIRLHSVPSFKRSFCYIFFFSKENSCFK